MLELNAVRFALAEADRARTIEDRDAALVRLRLLLTPGLVRAIVARVDDLEGLVEELDRRLRDAGT